MRRKHENSYFRLLNVVAFNNVGNMTEKVQCPYWADMARFDHILMKYSGIKSLSQFFVWPLNESKVPVLKRHLALCFSKVLKKKIVTGHTLGVFIRSVHPVDIQAARSNISSEGFSSKKNVRFERLPRCQYTFIYNYSISVTANINWICSIRSEFVIFYIEKTLTSAVISLSRIKNNYGWL